jgi:flagellar biosynthetic protein FliQ
MSPSDVLAIGTHALRVMIMPKLLAVSATLAIAGPWMLNLLVSYTRELITSIPSLLH